MHPFLAKCEQALAEIRAQGRYRRFVALEKLTDRFPYYRVTMDGRTQDILVWSSNDYLAMGVDDEVIAAAVDAAKRMGAGAAAPATSPVPRLSMWRWKRSLPRSTARRRRCSSPPAMSRTKPRFPPF